MALLALDVLYVRSLFYFEIQDTDINCYAGIAHGLLQGRALYSDLWDFKPPAVFWTYALAEKICGYGLSEVFFLNILFNGLALAGAYACGYGLSRSRWTGFLAACFWALVSPQVPLGANEPNTELFINVLQLFALLFWAGWKEGGGRRIFPLTAGLCLGAAALYKQVPVITACCMALAPLLAAKGTAARRAAAGEAGRLAAGFLAPWALTCAYYWAGGRLGLFLQATFADNLDQVSLADNLWSGWMPKNLWPGFFLYLTPLALAAFGGLWNGIRRGERAWSCWAGFAFAIPWEVSLRGTFYGHYYELWFPVLAVGGAWGLEALREGGRSRVFAGALALILVPMGFEHWRWCGLEPDQVGARAFPFFRAERPVGAMIARTLLPGEDYYEWTYDLTFNLAAGKPLSVGVPHGMMLFQPPSGEALSRRALVQLEEKKPELLVFDRDFNIRHFGSAHPDQNPVYQYLVQHYRPYQAVMDGRYLFCCRKGGALEARLRSARLDRKGKGAIIPPSNL